VTAPVGSSPDAAELAQARALILQHGWNSTVYQLLNPGIRLWFSRAGDAVVGYSAQRRRWLVVGAPVCAETRLPAVAREFEADAARGGARTLYFASEARLEAVYRGAPTHTRILLGAQPVWNPQTWAQTFEAQASLRAQRNRARNKGVAVHPWSPEAAHDHPDLAACLAEWLSTRRLPALHFMVEPHTLGRLAGRRIFVAEREGAVVGFLVASPVPRRAGWLLEQVIRGRAAPNGTAELLIDAAVRALAAEGSTYLTLGLAPLARRPGAGVQQPANPLWLRLLLGWVRAHGRRFYNFEGLEFFKAKFQPLRWEPVYAISNEPRFSPRTLYAVAAAFSGGAPSALLLGALGRAAKDELAALSRQLSRWRGSPSG
jgi:phosphatidylglycerol lysyltransferase